MSAQDIWKAVKFSSADESEVNVKGEIQSWTRKSRTNEDLAVFFARN